MDKAIQKAMTKEEFNIIREFLEGAPRWQKAMLTMAKYAGKEFSVCTYCGTSPEKMIELSAAIKKLLVLSNIKNEISTGLSDLM